MVMEKVRCGHVSPAVKKGKKKQSKGELDRLKQAEKKKRRLEKALANSAAIRIELEKKKQKKLEEQQRLDEEGAAVAEAVALHVLGDDTDESHHFMMNSTSNHNHRDHSSNIDLFMGYQSATKCSVDGLGWATNAYDPAWSYNSFEIGLALPHQFYVKDVQSPYFDKTIQGADISAGLLAAQAVSSLQIAEDSDNAQFAGHGAAAVINKKHIGKRVKHLQEDITYL